MNLLPGLRELRAPLAAGYLWIIAAFLWLSELKWLPTRRPGGEGWEQAIWDIGASLGKAPLLGILSFVAYLIGSFVEVGLNGRVMTTLSRPLGRRRAEKSIKLYKESSRYPYILDYLNTDSSWRSFLEGERALQAPGVEA